MLDYDDIKDKLQSALSIKRYRHTLGVVEESVKLAQMYSEDIQKAELAALLHDCAKDYPDKMKLRLCKEYHIELNDAMKSQPDLTHSFLGAEVANREYEIDDNYILDAIRYHTTGRQNMTLLDKIVFIADYIEPNRKYFESLDTIRKLAYTDIDRAMKLGLETTVDYVKQKGNKLHYLTLEALENYKNL